MFQNAALEASTLCKAVDSQEALELELGFEIKPCAFNSVTTLNE